MISMCNQQPYCNDIVITVIGEEGLLKKGILQKLMLQGTGKHLIDTKCLFDWKVLFGYLPYRQKL